MEKHKIRSDSKEFTLVSKNYLITQNIIIYLKHNLNTRQLKLYLVYPMVLLQQASTKNILS